jgi:hypothetical protein
MASIGGVISDIDLLDYVSSITYYYLFRPTELLCRKFTLSSKKNK